jgi:ATP phosphoribosyltransferase regulatory subunit
MSTNLTPFGVTDYNPNETQEFRNIINKASHVFDARSYRRIKTPTIEFYDSLAKGLGPSLKQKVVKFFDPNGQVLLLRPDNTTPIARLVATRMNNDALPLKLSYIDPIFRQSTDSLEGSIERFQAGVELIGDSSTEADAEVIITLIETLNSIGNCDFGIDIGHTELVDGLSEEKRQALLDNDYLSYGEIPARGDASVIQNNASLKALANTLDAKGYSNTVTYNTGLVKDLHYYSGVIFEAYDKTTKKIIASGGRYDGLLEKFGYAQPAVGFAIKIDALQG